MTTETVQERPPDKMTVPMLRVELEAAGVEYAKSAKKPHLVELVEAERAKAETVEPEEVEIVRNLPAVRASEAMVARGEVSTADVVEQRDKIRQVMTAVMQKGVHYGEIPGISKPTLLKPGAEVLAVTFRLAPSYKSERTYGEGDHLTVVSVATLTHIPTGLIVAEGEGLCTTREKKYAYRGEGRTCPLCGVGGTIKKSKYPPREGDYQGADPTDPPGWYCFAKTGGCGANFAASDPRIVDQSAERVANPDLPDTWNTVLKMANKRALVAAILNGTAASDIFTQDVEDIGEAAADKHEVGDRQRTPPAKAEGPKSWAQIHEWADRYGSEIGWRTWCQDASERLFAERNAALITPEQRGELGGKAAGAIVALYNAHPPDAFPPPNRETIQNAWASVLDGEVLPGPMWRLSPEEAELGVPEYVPEAGPASGTDGGEAPPAEPASESIADAEWTDLTPEQQAEVDRLDF